MDGGREAQGGMEATVRCEKLLQISRSTLKQIRFLEHESTVGKRTAVVREAGLPT